MEMVWDIKIKITIFTLKYVQKIRERRGNISHDYSITFRLTYLQIL
jgi:hypothetical protein